MHEGHQFCDVSFVVPVAGVPLARSTPRRQALHLALPGQRGADSEVAPRLPTDHIGVPTEVLVIWRIPPDISISFIMRNGRAQGLLLHSCSWPKLTCGASRWTARRSRLMAKHLHLSTGISAAERRWSSILHGAASSCLTASCRVAKSGLFMALAGRNKNTSNAGQPVKLSPPASGLVPQ